MSKASHIILGAAAGFAAGILFAPKSGKETREELKQKAKVWRGKAKDSYTITKEGATLVKDEVVEGAQYLKDIGRDAAGDAKAEVTHRAAMIKQEIADTAKSVKQRSRNNQTAEADS